MESYLDRYVLAGGFMMLFLIPTSLVAAAWIAQGYIRLRRGRVAPTQILAAARKLENSRAAARFQEMLTEHPAPLARLAAHLLRLNVVGPDAKSEEEEDDFLRPALSDEIDRLWQETTGLATIYAVAPLMGLLG
ncbi:MAG TPA: MotA/TolQ/ExbB proton channel family protein, partial [Sumerlaeia bacterium]|nr:MotA/TolQ/ExbB proton channel family protein [Sumerlaeia bacterium]